MKSNIIDKALKSLNIQEHFIIIHSNLLAFFKKTHHNPKKIWDIIYDNYKDKDGFVYIIYSGESTFG